jgi:hypothetical protein
MALKKNDIQGLRVGEKGVDSRVVCPYMGIGNVTRGPPQRRCVLARLPNVNIDPDITTTKRHSQGPGGNNSR